MHWSALSMAFTAFKVVHRDLKPANLLLHRQQLSTSSVAIQTNWNASHTSYSNALSIFLNILISQHNRCKEQNARHARLQAIGLLEACRTGTRLKPTDPEHFGSATDISPAQIQWPLVGNWELDSQTCHRSRPMYFRQCHRCHPSWHSWLCTLLCVKRLWARTRHVKLVLDWAWYRSLHCWGALRRIMKRRMNLRVVIADICNFLIYVHFCN